MSQSLHWTQIANFSAPEWDHIRRHAKRLADRVAGVRVAGADKNLGAIRIASDGDPSPAASFALNRMAANNRVVGEWEVVDESSEEVVRSVLTYAAQLCPKKIEWYAKSSREEVVQGEMMQVIRELTAAYFENPNAEAPLDEYAGYGEETAATYMQALTVARQAAVSARYSPLLFEGGGLLLKRGIRPADGELLTATVTTVPVKNLEEARGLVVGESRRLATEFPDGLTALDPDAKGLHLQSLLYAPAEHPLAQNLRVRGTEHDFDHLVMPLAQIEPDGEVILLPLQWLEGVRDRVNKHSPDIFLTDAPWVVEQCRGIAAGCAGDDPNFDVRELMENLQSSFGADVDTVFAAVADAYRRKAQPFHDALVVDIRRVREQISDDQVVCRVAAHDTNTTDPAERRFGQVLSRAFGEWNLALMLVEQSLSDHESYLEQARMARMPNAYRAPEQPYRDTLSRREAAAGVLGSFIRWRESVLNLTLNTLAVVGVQGAFGRIDAGLRGTALSAGSLTRGGGIPTVREPVREMIRAAKGLDVEGVRREKLASSLALCHLELLSGLRSMGLDSACRENLFAPNEDYIIDLIAEAYGSDGGQAWEILGELDKLAWTDAEKRAQTASAPVVSPADSEATLAQLPAVPPARGRGR